MVMVEPAIASHTAGFHSAGHTDGAVDIACPDSTSESEFTVVGETDDLIFRLEAQNAGHGTKDLFLGDTHVIGHVAEQSGTQEAAVLQFSLRILHAAAENLRAFLFADFHIAQDLFHLAFADLTAHLGIGFPGQSDLNGIEALHGFLNKTIIDGILNEYTGAGTADLPLIEENAHLEAIHGHFPVAVLKEDIGGLSAEFQRGGDDSFRSSEGNIAADLSRTGEGQFPESL